MNVTKMNRPTLAEQEDLIKESLFKFVRKHIPSAQLRDMAPFEHQARATIQDLLSSIDEIVLSYVVSILEDLGSESSVEEAFDVEGFCEMMAAYFPEFSTIHHASDSYSEPQVRLLQEMFPGVCSIEVHHCLSIAEGDVARAAQLVLHRQEAGQSLKTNVTRQKAVVNDQELKSRIIARYSYVDKDDDIREHRPVGPKSEPKKLVRYRDNKIVSLKGERFTEVKKEEDEDMKKTYVSIKPARQYRFH
uniref:CUE domain-containing protein 2 n=1 Tax=Timema shepardi TaxID=629360 RepID=A0A7R9AVT8_TIMSH|nr:unnamed protein product [Timema shepardi]